MRRSLRSYLVAITFAAVSIAAYYALADYQSGSPGNKTVNLGPLATLGITELDMITATATDADGNTSEFYPAMIPTAAGVEVSGRVMGGGRPIKNARVTMNGTDGQQSIATTNTFGYFRFRDIPAGAGYSLSVTARGYVFQPIFLSVDDNVSDLVIEGVRP